MADHSPPQRPQEMAGLVEQEPPAPLAGGDDSAARRPSPHHFHRQAYAAIEKGVGVARANFIANRFSSPDGDLYDYAEVLVRAARERAKPNDQREGFTDSALPLIEKQLLDERPIHPWLDELKMEWSLSKAREYLGADDPQTKLLLGKESPEGLAERLVKGSKLADPKVRKALWDGGAAAIAEQILRHRRGDALTGVVDRKAGY